MRVWGTRSYVVRYEELPKASGKGKTPYVVSYKESRKVAIKVVTKELAVGQATKSKEVAAKVHGFI